METIVSISRKTNIPSFANGYRYDIKIYAEICVRKVPLPSFYPQKIYLGLKSVVCTALYMTGDEATGYKIWVSALCELFTVEKVV